MGGSPARIRWPSPISVDPAIAAAVAGGVRWQQADEPLNFCDFFRIFIFVCGLHKHPHVKIRFSCAGAYVDHTKNKNLKKKSQKKTLATVRSGPPCSVAAACRIRAREPQSPPLMRGGARRRVPSPPPTTCHRLRCPPPVATPAEADPPATEPPATTS